MKIVFIAPDEASYVVGSMLVIDRIMGSRSGLRIRKPGVYA